MMSERKGVGVVAVGGGRGSGEGLDFSEGELLVVDDEPRILKMLKRRFEWLFGRVHLASTPVEADEVIRSHPITHVVCDYDLGREWADGVELLTGWRREFIKIDRAVIFTGTPPDELGVVPEEINAVVPKGTQSFELILEAFYKSVPSSRGAPGPER